MAQRLHIGRKFHPSRSIKQFADGLTHELGLAIADEFTGRSCGKHDCAPGVDLKQKVGVGERKTEQAGRIDHDEIPEGPELAKETIRELLNRKINSGLPLRAPHFRTRQKGRAKPDCRATTIRDAIARRAGMPWNPAGTLLRWCHRGLAPH